MEDKYNILITYSGDGDFKFMVRRIGEVIISRNKPVYIYNAPANVINELRILRRLLLNVIIGAKPAGAYKVYDYNDYTEMPRAIAGMRPNLAKAEPISNGEIASILKGGNKPAEPEKVEEPKKEEAKEEKPKTTKKSTKKKTSKKK